MLQVVSIVNCTSRAQRLHLLPPRSPYVTFSYDKEGNVGPGMSQAVTVTFTPHEEGRYYYDVLRIHCKVRPTTPLELLPTHLNEAFFGKCCRIV